MKSPNSLKGGIDAGDSQIPRPLKHKKVQYIAKSEEKRTLTVYSLRESRVVMCHVSLKDSVTVPSRVSMTVALLNLENPSSFHEKTRPLRTFHQDG